MQSKKFIEFSFFDQQFYIIKTAHSIESLKNQTKSNHN